MRVKQIWDFVPLPKKFKLAWDRITVSKLTIVYFLFALAHCMVQVILQVHAFTINQQAATILNNVVVQGNANITGFPYYDNRNLYVCDQVPTTFSTRTCQNVWGPDLHKSYGNGSSTDAHHRGNASQSASASDSAASATSSVLLSSSAGSVSSTESASSTSSASVSSGLSSTSSPTVTSSASAPSKTGSGARVVEVKPTTTTLIITETLAVTVPAPKKRHHLDFGTISHVKINGSEAVQVSGFGLDHQNVTLSQQCLVTLNWPVMTLDNTKREDIVFVAFQVWVLGMSIVAILNESIPHIIASLLTHLLATCWAAYQLARTAEFEKHFDMITTNGACQINLLETYWTARRAAEVPGLVLNVVALGVSAFLSWRIIKVFGWQTFKRIGASLAINRIYKIVLSLSIIIQLAFFFVISSCAIWIDQLCNGWIGMMAMHMNLYRGVTIAACILMVPWLGIGWFAVRREEKHSMTVFLVLCVLYLGGWSGMFAARTFRWTFFDWTFFTILYTASAVLVLVALILGIWSRVNFGHGLSNYLNAQETLPGDDFVAVTDAQDLERSASRGSAFSEKIAFPSPTGPVPTYAEAFGPEQPRPPMPAHMVSPARSSPVASLARTESNASTRSHSSQHSIGKRFVIE